jgi:C4-dicarboxylate-specific signal transduction histidine kinase
METVLCISRDVTERVRAQEQAQLHIAELAHVSRLSTVGELVTEIAHEINQPLHAIVNFSQASINVLEKTPVSSRPDLFGWLKQISEQANRAAEIIRRAGRFARKTPVRRSSANVNDLIHECLKLVNFDLRLHHVKLECELAADLPLVLADPIQVQQVLVNLVRNAVDAMSENQADDRRLSVRTENCDEGVQISVRDNGRGIDAENSPKLFEPFFTTKADGMGMGLAVSQSIVQAHGGRLWAEPNDDRGVTFYFTLSARKEARQNVYSHA